MEAKRPERTNKIMQRYPNYEPIHFDYVRELPAGWQLVPNIAIFDSRNEKGFVNEELLSVTISKGVIKQSELDKKDSSNPDKSSYKLVKPGDVVYSMRFRQGACGYSQYRGLVSNVCQVLKPRIPINPKYFHYQFRLPFYQDYAKRYSYGIADGQFPLRWKFFKRMYSILPPLETQHKIVGYLERKELLTNIYITKKNRLAELILEQIYSTIYADKQTGSDENYSWERLFPKTWRLKRAKWMFFERNTRKHPQEKLLAVTQHKGVVFKDEIEENYVSPSEYDNLKLVCENDFVISLRSFEGGIEYSNIRGIVSPAYTIIHLNEYNNSTELEIFYSYLFKSKPFICLLNTIISGIRDGKNINYRDFRNLFIPFPDEITVSKVKDLHFKYLATKKKNLAELNLISELLQSEIFSTITGNSVARCTA